MHTDSPDIKALLGRSLVHKYLTGRLLDFVSERSISGLFSSMGSFTAGDAAVILQQGLGYRLDDGIRTRMVRVMTDFLFECGHIANYNGRYCCIDGGCDAGILSAEETAMAKELFKGQVDFFERCLLHADTFLKGGPPLYSFESDAAQIWEDFLGNAEFNFARSVLANVMLSGRCGNAEVLDLCYGPGFDIQQIQRCAGSVRITALDFKDIFRGRALGRIPNPKAVSWVDSAKWGGFGTRLPFPADAFDTVFFACADPYVAGQSREFVYRDIFRVIKPGGSLNILSHSYPDPEKRFVGDIWVRRGTLCHDFAESVCEGWHGFYPAGDSLELFESIGFRVGKVMMNSSVWRLDKP